jgi:cyclic-di-AMP phosphodiesterase PgpH
MDKDKREPEKRPLQSKPSGSGSEGSLGARLSGLFGQEWFILVSLSLLVAVMLSSNFITIGPRYHVGEVADRNIKAKHEFLIEDEQPTQKKREEAGHESPLIYDFEEDLGTVVAQRLEAAFEPLRQFMQKQTEILSSGSILPPDRSVETSAMNLGTAPLREGISRQDLTTGILERKEQFERTLGCEVSEPIYLILVQKRFSHDIQDRVLQWTDAALSRGVLSSRPSTLLGEGKHLLVRHVQSKKEILAPSAQDYFDIAEAQQFIRNLATAQAADSDPDVMRAALALSLRLIKPSLSFNLSETESLKEAAVNAVKPVFIKLKKNEMLVREGQRIGPEELLKLRTHEQKMPKHNQGFTFLSLFLLTALTIRVFFYVAQQHLPAFRLEPRDMLFLAVLFIFLMAMARSSAWLTDTIADSSVYFSGKALLFAVPLTAGAMFASIFFGASVALFFSLLLCVLTGMLWGRDFQLFFYFLLGSFIAAHGVATCRNRMAPIRAGLLVGCANVAMIVLAALLQDQLGAVTILMQSLCGFCGGVFAGILVTGFTPLAEMLFGYTTDIKLLELASMDQPLLQELMVQAPGTYHHSVIVSNMVEAAARSIGANSLLAKVAAYYHDIGKTKKSLYFIENQLDGENRHEKLAPSMSSLILIAHVKEGAELAKQHKLGQPIVDIISQHHGTRLISFFYQKALDAREKTKTSKGGELPPIDVEDYRYPGPKPQTKEAGLVMLADVVEAACRALPEPTCARIQGLVNKLINNIFIDGQLDECELTLKDLHQIAKRFNQILATIHHKRIDYPALTPKEMKNKAHADSNQREPKADRDRPAALEEGSKVDLKRLGLH